jgi:hypothetical protein
MLCLSINTKSISTILVSFGGVYCLQKKAGLTTEHAIQSTEEFEIIGHL